MRWLGQRQDRIAGGGVGGHAGGVFQLPDQLAGRGVAQRDRSGSEPDSGHPPAVGRHGKRHEDEATLRDRRVREHAHDVGLAERDEVPEDRPLAQDGARLPVTEPN